MRRFYSPRGAKRGLFLAALFLSAWCGWALGYMQSDPPSAAVLIVEQASTHTQKERTTYCRIQADGLFL